MTAPKTGDTIKELCPKCGQYIAACTCGKLERAVAWPMSGNRPRSAGEMSDTFWKLKEAGTGTTFAPASQAQEESRTTPIDLAPDAIIGGVYKIIRLIGRGGMGEVYLARHLTLGKKCALKVIPPDQVTEVGWQRFQLEAKTVAKLEHVNLVRVTDLGIHEGCLPFYAMEYLEGKSLAETLVEYGPIAINKALEIFVQVCDGVECAHLGGILHRDLKPANIMLTATAAGRVEVKILDFGLAKLTKHDRFKQSLTAVGDVFGSPHYMSPEQCGGGELDNRSDIYSIGCTLFETLTGRPPFYGQLAAAVFFGHLESDPPSLEHVAGPGKFPHSMEAVMVKLLRKDPDERYQTLSELKEDLILISSGRNITTSVADAEEEESGESEASKSSESSESLAPLAQLLSQPKVVPWLVLAMAVPFGLALLCQLNAQPTTRAGESPSTLKDHGGTVSPKPELPKVTLAGVGSATGGDIIVIRSDEQEGGSWDGTPFYKGIVTYGDKKCQHWSYHGGSTPPLYLEVEGTGGVQKGGLVGDVYIPASEKVCVLPRLPLIKQPALVKGLVDSNFDGVDFEWYSSDDIQAVAPALAKCQSVKALKIGNFAWSIKDSRASVAAVNQFSGLDRLVLSAPYEGSTLAKMNRLKELRELRLNLSQPYLHDCLKVIGASKNLRSLGLPTWNLPPADFELLVQCPNLEELVIGQLTGTREQCLLLAELPGLQRLEMPALRFRPGLMADLTLLKSLKSLKLVITNGWTEERLELLRRQLPGVKIAAYASAANERDAQGRL